MTSDNKTSFTIKQTTGVIISLLLTAIFLYIAFHGVNFSRIINLISQSSIFWIIVLILSLLLSHFLRAVRWKIIIGSVKPNASLLNLFGALMVGYGVNCAIPRLGEVSRAVVLGRWEKLSRSSLFGTVIVERVIDILAFAATVVISAFIWTGNLYANFPWLKTSIYIVTVLMVAIILFLFLLIEMKEKLSKVIVRIIGKVSEKFANKIAYIFEMLLMGFGSLKGIRNYFLTVLITVIILLIYALNSYIGFLIVGMENITSVNYGMAWMVMSISSIGVIIPTPGGTGSYHTLAKSVLVLLFGFGEEISLAYAIVTHIVSYLLFVVTALVFFFWLDKKYAKRNGRREKFSDIIKTQMDEE
ncbi:MAG: lysylphosphatidylglycerol synthase transmembrane domain-containing protein [Ignavibacteriales bacterium]|nr:lysylphosphatidylglycerol synthase transmembrane domain-containing protein [Ignavibacteriales bacterium]